jgi:uncharacterized protein (TIGR00156 family)
MKQMQTILGGLVLAAALAATTAVAQYKGPGAQQPAAPVVLRKVAEVLKAPVDDQHVELTGVLVRQTGRETYVFRDDSGEIQVEIDRDDFPAGQPVDATTRVVIHGEVDTRLARAPEIDVERLSLPPGG